MICSRPSALSCMSVINTSLLFYISTTAVSNTQHSAPASSERPCPIRCSLALASHAHPLPSRALSAKIGTPRQTRRGHRLWLLVRTVDRPPFARYMVRDKSLCDLRIVVPGAWCLVPDLDQASKPESVPCSVPGAKRADHPPHPTTSRPTDSSPTPSLGARRRTAHTRTHTHTHTHAHPPRAPDDPEPRAQNPGLKRTLPRPAKRRPRHLTPHQNTTTAIYHHAQRPQVSPSSHD